MGVSPCVLQLGILLRTYLVFMFNVAGERVSYGVFRGLRLNCCDLLRAIENYCGQTYMRAPHVATMELATSLLANEIPTTSFKLKDL